MFSNLDLVRKITIELSQDFIYSQHSQGTLLLIGGLQGSGKTSLSERIKKVSQVNIISTDAIRQSLFNRGMQVSPEFTTCLNHIFENLVKCSLSNNCPTIIDANAHSKRLQDIEKLLKKNELKCKVVKIFLKASEEILRNRVSNRQPMLGYYQGTEEDLKASLLTVKIDLKDYDLVIETDKATEDEVYKQVTSFFNEVRWNLKEGDFQ